MINTGCSGPTYGPFPLLSSSPIFRGLEAQLENQLSHFREKKSMSRKERDFPKVMWLVRNKNRRGKAWTIWMEPVLIGGTTASPLETYILSIYSHVLFKSYNSFVKKVCMAVSISEMRKPRLKKVNLSHIPQPIEVKIKVIVTILSTYHVPVCVVSSLHI